MKPLRVLHVNTFDVAGGAARAARRLHLALGRQGVDSHMLVMHRDSDGPQVLQPHGPLRRRARRVLEAASSYAMALQRSPTNPVLHSLNFFPSGLGRWIDASDFDLVHLHWVGGDMLSVGEIGRIRKPLCWTLHDTWALAGAEHYDDLAHPGRYRQAYDADNRPPDHGGLDLDRWTWRRKARAWAGQRFQLIAPSQWMARSAMESALLRDHPCAVIPNTLDTEVFRPVDRAAARRALGLDPGKRYLLFGASGGVQDPRKGFHLLLAALEALARRPGVAGTTELLVFGAADTVLPPLPLPARNLGVFTDEARLATVYAAADVFAAPSMQDNLPNTVAEALACGTPTVAFAIGGLPDLVTHRETGWLAQPFDTADFAAGLEHVLGAGGFGPRCREHALALLQGERVTAQHAAVYAQALARAPA